METDFFVVLPAETYGPKFCDEDRRRLLRAAHGSLLKEASRRLQREYEFYCCPRFGAMTLTLRKRGE